MTEPAIDPDVVDEDEFTELSGAVIGRIDLVGKGANGLPFLIAKGDGTGMLSEQAVRDLLDANLVPEATAARDDVTISGSPAAISKMIYEAAQRAKHVDYADALDETVKRIHKATVSTKDQNDAPDSDFAYIEPGGEKDESGKTTPRSKRHFYIGDAAHVRNALSRAPQSPFGDKALPKIHAAAKKFGIDVSKEQTMTTPSDVSKADAPDLDIEEPLAGDGESSGMPGSPEWEAVDAATACKWIAVLGRAKNALCLLSEREMQEAVVGDDDDAGKAFDLQDAASAVDCAISILAPFAVSEQFAAEADDNLQLVGKALSEAAAPIDVIEQYAPVVKAGRVLSAVNESKLRDAVASLQQVLATLPAPVDDSGQSVAKEADMAATPTEITVEVTPVIKEEALAEVSGQLTSLVSVNDGAPELTLGIVRKAKGDPVVVVFNADGKLIGVVDPDDLLPVASNGGSDSSSDDAPAADEPAAAPADDAAPAADDSAPAADAATVPGTDTVQAPAPAAATDDVNKSTETKSEGLEAFAALLKEALAPLAEQTGSAAADLATVVKGLQERVDELAKMPDDRKSPALNGVASTGAGNESGSTEYAELRKAVDEADTPSAKRDALQRLAYAEIRGRFNG